MVEYLINFLVHKLVICRLQEKPYKLSHLFPGNLPILVHIELDEELVELNMGGWWSTLVS